jgi:hypothetical protein
MPKILGGEARGRKKVRMATKWDRIDKVIIERAFKHFVTLLYEHSRYKTLNI